MSEGVATLPAPSAQIEAWSTPTTQRLTKTTPFKHQAEIIEETKDHVFFGLFMEQGTGKTHVTLATIQHLYNEGKIDGVLVLAPNGVHDNWARNEIPLHSALAWSPVAVWHSSDGVKKRNLWTWACRDTAENPFVFLLANIEAVRTDEFMKSIVPFVKNRRFMLVIDESTIIKNPKAIQTKAVMKIAKLAAYRRILTGTPITQSPLDLWSQCRVLSESILPYPSYTAFKHEYAIEETMNLGTRTFQKILGYKNQSTLAALIAPFTKRILKKDCLDLPDKVYATRYVELTPEQKRIYKDLVKQCLATVGSGVITVTSAITMMLRLHQVTLGYTTTDDGTIRPIDHNRIKVLMDLLEENTTKAIIFCRFLEDVDQVAQLLIEGDQSYDYVVYDGRVSGENREKNVNRFQNDIACRYFIATSAAAKGLTLTAAEQVIYYSQGFSLETRLQSEDRAHRIGQKKTVTYTDLVAQGTIDDKVIEALKRKTELANSVLDAASLAKLIQLEE